jgi:formate-dependent nitrite reductase membrane component NrfD
VFLELSSHGSAHVELALQAMTRGRYAGRFWGLGVGVGMVLPLSLALVALTAPDDPTTPTGAVLGVLAGLATIVGLYGYEDAFVRAGQAVPLS